MIFLLISNEIYFGRAIIIFFFFYNKKASNTGVPSHLPRVKEGQKDNTRKEGMRNETKMTTKCHKLMYSTICEMKEEGT